MSVLAPGLHVFYANQVESLAAQLAMDLTLYRGVEGAWKSATIVVPNPNVKDYLRASFAEAFGAVANLEFRYLEGFWNRYSKQKLLDRATLFGSILSVLQDPEIGRDPNLQPLILYMEGAPKDLKAVQLCQRLAQHYERILLQRPDWIRSWDRGLTARGAEPASLETWQRTLWGRLRKAWKNLPNPPLPLLDWLDDPSFATAPFPEVVFLFGMSHMAPVFHHALAKVGARSSVRLYLVNPCEEPWDEDPLQRPHLDLEGGEPPEGDDPFSLHRDRSEVILQRWARPAREQLRLLAGLAQGDFMGRFLVPEGPTLLAYLQQRILKPEGQPNEVAEECNSLRVVPCPSPRREAETVANLIWELLRTSKGSLHFGDIGVLVPSSEQDAYQEHLGAAFRSAHDIPWAKAMGASRALQELVEASLLLLDIAGGELTRAELLRAASHPFIHTRLGASPENWAQLCDQAGIVSHLDAQETAGTYLEGGRWTWEEGLTRLALGRFMKDDAEVEGLGPKGRPVGRAESASMLALLGPLTTDLRTLAKGRFSLAVWQERLDVFLRTYLAPDRDEATESDTAAFQKVRLQLQKINQFQLDGLRQSELDFQAVRSLVKLSLETLLSDNSLPPGRGVQVSCYTPLRAIPFKVLFLMGLGEGLFPATDRLDPLDLVASSPRRAGDVSRPEQERQLFLEAVLCARQQLVCTYPSRTSTTGDPLQPSPLLLDMQETLGPDLWRQVRYQEQPLHRHDLSLFPDLDTAQKESARVASIPNHIPAARQEAEARWLGQNLRAEIGNRDLPRTIAAMGGSPGLRAGLIQFLGDCGPIGEAESRLPSQFRITLKELRRWLECPVQGGVSLRLGVKSPDEDNATDVEDFPMDSSPLDQWELLRRTFWTRSAERSEFEAVYADVRRDKESQAKVPIGPLSEGERQRHLTTLNRWDALVGPIDGLTLHRFGRGRPYETKGVPIQDHPALMFDLDHDLGATQIRLEGLTEPLRGDEFLMLSTSEGTKAGPSDKARLESLRPWLSHLALCASGDSELRYAILHTAPKGKPDAIWRLPLPAVDPDEANRLLLGWCEELIVVGVQKLLPIEALLSTKEIPDLTDWIQDQKDDADRPKLTSFRGPVPRVKDLPVDDLATGHRRLEAFLALQAGWVQA